MPAFTLEIDDVSYNGITGHRSVTAHVVEIVDEHTTIIGAPETHGIDPVSLLQIWGSLGNWLANVKVGMVARHQMRTALDHELLKMRGTRI